MRVIAEIGLSHEGSLGQAMAYCDAVAKAGADIVKFQCHTGDPVKGFRPGTKFPQDETRQDYWRRTAFNQHDWEELVIYAHKCGLEFCVSVFSHEAIDLLEGMYVDYWKVGSAQVGDTSLVRRLAATTKPLIISSGMSDWDEIDKALDTAHRERFINTLDSGGVTVMHCVSKYPTEPHDVGINVVRKMMARYNELPVGISDHSGTIWPSIIAASMGAVMCEVHVCWHRDCFGPDVPASITIDELRQLVQGVRFIEKMKPVDKDEQAKSMADMRRLFRCEK